MFAWLRKTAGSCSSKETSYETWRVKAYTGIKRKGCQCLWELINMSHSVGKMRKLLKSHCIQIRQTCLKHQCFWEIFLPIAFLFIFRDQAWILLPLWGKSWIYTSAVRLIHTTMAKNPSESLMKLQILPEHFEHFAWYAAHCLSYFFVFLFFLKASSHTIS